VRENCAGGNVVEGKHVIVCDLPTEAAPEVTHGAGPAESIKNGGALDAYKLLAQPFKLPLLAAVVLGRGKIRAVSCYTLGRRRLRV